MGIVSRTIGGAKHLAANKLDAAKKAWNEAQKEAAKKSHSRALDGHPTTRRATNEASTAVLTSGSDLDGHPTTRRRTNSGVPNAVSASGSQVQPGASSGPVKAEPKGEWVPENEAKVQEYINNSLEHNNGNVELAFAELRDLRQKEENYYDTNLAIAADYLRARWETQKCGPAVAGAEVAAYLELKKHGKVPKEGPGPVSPYSKLQEKYMYKGVADETNQMSLATKLWWHTQPGIMFGLNRATFGVLSGDASKVG
jgi:hypothetical protein